MDGATHYPVDPNNEYHRAVSAKSANLSKDASMTQTATLTLCQYCEHANPEDAKFCAGCGAPLHLIPCPKCGAVNQKTSKTCYQCHGELRESTEILLANTPASASEEVARNAVTAASSTPYITAPVPTQRQPIVVVAIILSAFAAAAYFAYQQRGAVDAKRTTATQDSAKSPATAPSSATTGSINNAPPPSKPAALAVPTTAATQAKDAVPPQTSPTADVKLTKVDDAPAAAVSVDATTRPTRRRRAVVENDAPSEEPPAGNRARASEGLIKPAPLPGACTPAIAALGLCTPAPTKGRE